MHTPIQKLKSSQKVGRCASLNQLGQHLENCIYPGKSAGPSLKARHSFLYCTLRHLDSAVGMLSDPEPFLKNFFFTWWMSIDKSLVCFSTSLQHEMWQKGNCVKSFDRAANVNVQKRGIQHSLNLKFSSIRLPCWYLYDKDIADTLNKWLFWGCKQDRPGFDCEYCLFLRDRRTNGDEGN